MAVFEAIRPVPLVESLFICLLSPVCICICAVLLGLIFGFTLLPPFRLCVLCGIWVVFGVVFVRAWPFLKLSSCFLL